MKIWWLLAAYLLGSIPFSLLIARIWNVDLRRVGSGNVGATNVLRTLGPIPGAIALLLDFGKGLLAVYLGYRVGGDPEMVILMGVAAVFGHMFPVFLKFQGGKGVATGVGVLAGIAPDLFVVALLMEAGIVLITRYVSLASIISSLTIAALMFVLHRPLPYSAAVLLMAVFILIRHIPNIKRLLAGTENRI